MTNQRYVDQVTLLLRSIQEIAREDMFALKGATAINLFVRDLPVRSRALGIFRRYQVAPSTPIFEISPLRAMQRGAS